MGKDAPWRELDSIGLSKDDWNEDKEYWMDQYLNDINSEAEALATDFIKYELPYYQKKESAGFPMGYEEYLKRMGLKDSRRSWIEWKMDVYGMSEQKAIRSAYDKEWGYKPLSKTESFGEYKPNKYHVGDTVTHTTKGKRLVGVVKRVISAGQGTYTYLVQHDRENGGNTYQVDQYQIVSPKRESKKPIPKTEHRAERKVESNPKYGLTYNIDKSRKAKIGRKTFVDDKVWWVVRIYDKYRPKKDTIDWADSDYAYFGKYASQEKAVSALLKAYPKATLEESKRPTAKKENKSVLDGYLQEIDDADGVDQIDEIMERAANESDDALSNMEYEKIYDKGLRKAQGWQFKSTSSKKESHVVKENNVYNKRRKY